MIEPTQLIPSLMIRILRVDHNNLAQVLQTLQMLGCACNCLKIHKSEFRWLPVAERLLIDQSCCYVIHDPVPGEG